MPEILHGIKVTELLIGTRPINIVSTAVIGLIATAIPGEAEGAEAALDAAFPLNTPVPVTDIRKAIGLAGADGTLKPALEAIADQASPVLVVVRVAEYAPQEGDDAQDILDGQNALVIGTTEDNIYTGAQALLAAELQLGVKPRIIGAPGLDTAEVTAELVTIAQALRGMVYAQCGGDDVAGAIAYAGDFAARELMLLWPKFGNDFAGDTAARALGLRAKIDQEQGWNKTLSNVPVNGVLALDRDVSFDILGGETDASLLNDAKIVALVRSPDGGFRFWGNRTRSAEPLFAFESATRTAQVLKDSIAAGLTWAIDKPLTSKLKDDIVESVNRTLRRLTAQQRIIGGSAWYDPGLNSQEALAGGQLVIDFDFTPTAPLEGLTVNQRITDRYYADFAALAAA